MIVSKFECPFFAPGTECGDCGIGQLDASMRWAALNRTLHTDHNPKYRDQPTEKPYALAANDCFDKRLERLNEAVLYGEVSVTMLPQSV